MGHPTPEGLEQEEGPLCIAATKYLTQLGPRGITADFLTGYAAKLQAMKDAFAAHLGTTSDKKQLTVSEQVAKHELLLDVHIMQEGAKRTFPWGSPQLREFHVGEKYNRSTALLVRWAGEIAVAWKKYETELTNKGRLIQKDVDTMVANSAILGSADATQENAKRVDAPEATVAAWQAMDNVIDAADAIYGAAEAEFAKNPQVLGEFEKLKPLRYSMPPRPKGPNPPPPQTNAPQK